MSKRKQKQTSIDVPEPHIGRTYKLWSERSDRDFSRWVRFHSYMSSIYRIAYLILGVILLLIGSAILLTGSKNDGIGFIAIGFGIILLLVIGGLIKL